MIDKLDAALRFDQQAIGLRVNRQEILAANIANADTPNYKARDVDFAAELRRTIERGSQGGALALATTSGRHLEARAAAGVAPGDLLYRMPNQPSIDGNTVEMDTERVQFAENAIHYETGLTVLGSKIKSLLAALQQ